MPEEKICSKCGNTYPIDFYRKLKSGKNGLMAHCRDCGNIMRREYDKSHPWRTHYEHARERCNKAGEYYPRGILFKMTGDEFKRLWFRDKAYLLKKPSIDRINNKGNYEYANCRFIEFSENVRKDIRKKVWQIKDGYKKLWDNETIASQMTGICCQNISRVVHGRVKTAGGYVWKLAEVSESVPPCH